MEKVTVIGAGSWGTALAMVLADNNKNVTLYSRNEETVNDININNKNSKYLPGIALPLNINATNNLENAVKDSNYILWVVPSHATRETATKIQSFLNNDTVVIHASKGIENESLKTISEILNEELTPVRKDNIVVLSGPSHAEEVSNKIPTTVVSSSHDINKAKEVQKLFSNEYFRVYTNTDVKGVELGGALKNIIALGAGISDGLGLGDNGKAALLTRGLAEIIRLGVALGAKQETFSGLAGMGDLIVTGTSKHSRNWRTGNLLAKGHTLQEALDSLGMVAEGVKTTKSAFHLAQKHNVDTPIINALYSILFENEKPENATKKLMKRMYKDEN